MTLAALHPFDIGLAVVGAICFLGLVVALVGGRD